MNKATTVGFYASTFVIFMLWAANATAWESYHDPAQNDSGWCATCHPGFAGGRSDALHSLHTGGSDPVTTNCNLCHTGSGRDNPLTMWSTGDADDGLGCTGCHGRDYGRTIEQDYRGFTITGKPKNSGMGLRQHHMNSGINICRSCHLEDPDTVAPLNDAPPYPEDVTDPGLGNTVHYYLRTDVSLAGAPVDPCTNEDTANPETLGDDLLGLDNDGDLLYDLVDPDCVGNRPPEAVDDAYTTDEDTLLSVAAPGVLGNDSDPDGDALTVALIGGTTSGALTLNGDGSFTYDPDPDFAGTDSFTYVANDGTDDSNIANVIITVNDVNDAPVANDDSYATDENTQLSVTAPGVLANDTDVEGDVLTATLVTDVSNGTLVLAPDGSFTYDPALDFAGMDSFTYLANDGAADSNVATVMIDVRAVNDPPVAVDDAYATDEDTPLSVPAPGVLGNDNDPDGGPAPLTATLVTPAGNGAVTLNGDGSFTYAPALNFFGADSFTYVANDGADDSNIATVNLTVNDINDAPVADPNGPYTGVAGQLVTFDGSGSSDVDGTIVTYMWDFGDGNTGAGVSPTHTYAAAGLYTVTLTATDDDGATDTNSTSADIVAAPNVPPVAVDDAYATDEDTPLSVPAPGVLGNDNDPDSGPNPLTASLVTPAANGTVTLNPDGSFTYAPALNFFGADSFTYVANDGADDSNIATVNITVNDINDVPVADPNGPYTGVAGQPVAFDGSGSSDVDGTIVTYMWDFGDGNTGAGVSPTHTYAAAGLYTVTLTVTDDDGATDTNSTSADIVAAPNVPPVAVDDAYATDEDTPLSVPAPGVLGNDNDPDSGPNPLTASLVTPAANGTVTLNPDGSFTYAPALNFFGADSFTYVANDGADDSNIATVNLTVNDINDAPVADPNGPYTGVAGDPVAFDGSGSSDVDGTIVTYMWDFGDGNTGAGVSPTHTYAAAGLYTVTLTATDDDGATDTNSTSADIVAAPNVPPVAVDDAYATDEDTPLSVPAPGVLGNDNDPDSGPNPLTASLVTPAANGTVTLNPDGSFTYAPALNFFGADSFTYVANDGADDSNIATVNLTVNDINDVPVADPNGPYTGVAGQPVAFDGSGSSDVDGTIVTYMWDFGDGNTGAGVSPTHTYAAAGLYTVTLTVTDDDGATDTNSTSADIAAAPNVPPVAVDDAYATDEDTPLSVPAPGVLGNDNDPDSGPNPLTASLVTPAANGTVTLNPDGSFTYAPALNSFGADSFTYVANDGADDSNIATVNLTVNDINDAPVADPNGPYTGVAGQLVTFDGSGSSDVDGTIVTYMWDFGDGNTGAGVSPTHTYAAAGLYTVTLTVTDDDGATDTNSTSADIVAANVPPVAVDDAYATDEETPLSVPAPGVLGNDNDPDSGPNPLTATLVTPAANGTVTLNPDGSFTYSPNLNFFGSDSFTYVANDGADDSNIATVNLTVNDINDAPVADPNGPYTGVAGQPVAFDGSGSSDVDGTIVTYMWDFGDGNTGAGVSPTHTYAAAGLYTVTLTVTDDDGATDTNSTSADIAAAPNVPPVAVDDVYATDEDTPLSVPAPGVLGNDNDPDSGPNPLTASLVTPAANGTVTLNPDGSFTYAPALNFFGADSFTYVANDGADDSNIATVNLTVNDINDAPVADPNGPYTGTVGNPVAFDGSGSSDVDGTIVSYMWDFGDGNTGTGVSPTHTYAAAGLYPVTLTVTDDVGATDTAATTADIQELRVDLDIAQFQVTKRIRLDNVKPAGIKLVVRNEGQFDDPRMATVVGVRNGIEVYNETLMVSDALGNGRSTFTFPPYTPTSDGDIMWTATVFDDDPDLDAATAVTTVVPLK